MLKKFVQNQKNFLLRSTPPPPWGIRKIFFSIHVPQYMEFCIFFKSMYPCTWYFVFSSNPCPWVHRFEKKKKIPCTGVHESEKKYSYVYLKGRVGDRSNFFLVLDKFFQHVKKILNFWNFVNIKVAQFKLNHLGFYCIYSLFW